MSKKLWPRLVVLLVAVAIILGGNRVFRARSKIVTLNARDADIRDVVRQIERQTWETIPVHQEVSGRVTLDVMDAPLRDVLGLVAEQANAHAQELQPLYSSSASLDSFLRATRGEVEPAKAGWSKLADVIHPPLTAPPRQGPSPGQSVTLQLTNRELRLAGLAFARLTQVQVVPEDGTQDRITLQLQRASPKEAATALAKAVQRQTKAFLSVLPGSGLVGGPGRGPGPGRPGGPGGPPGPPGSGGPPPGGPPGRPLPGGPDSLSDPAISGRPGILPPNPESRGGPVGGLPSPGGLKPPSREMREQMERDYQELLTVLPKEEAARLEAERASQNVMEHGLPDQRQAMGSQLGPMFEMRRERLLQSSVDERVDMDRQKAMEATSAESGRVK